jgi:hypothetical protein
VLAAPSTDTGGVAAVADGQSSFEATPPPIDADLLRRLREHLVVARLVFKGSTSVVPPAEDRASVLVGPAASGGGVVASPLACVAPGDETFFVEDLQRSRRLHPELFWHTPVIQQTPANHWFTLARCLAALRGRHTINRADWALVKLLERERLARQLVS